MKNNVLETLKKRLKEIAIDNYNDTVREWSKGYKRGFSDAVNMFERLHKETVDKDKQ